jgi:nucleoside-diphosphate-sugar epimerase
MSNRLTSSDQNGAAPANRPVLVLGGLGFMGSHISRALVRRGYSVASQYHRYVARRITFAGTDKSICRREVDVPNNVLSYSRLQKETGWQPQVKFENGIGRVVEGLSMKRQES